MARGYNLLTARAVDAISERGRHPDGGNLYLRIGKDGRRNWVFLYQMDGKRHEMGLGPAGKLGVALADARELADQARRVMRAGGDPLKARLALRAKALGDGKTFKDVGELYYAAHQGAWRNDKHRQQWRMSLDRYLYPKIGHLGLNEIDTGAVMDVLEPLWNAKTETASRLRGRMELVLDYAKARGWRHGDNPARWRGHLDKLLPHRSKVAIVEHHKALPWQEIGVFLSTLKDAPGMAAKALEFLILTAARTSEVIGATWGEINLDAKTWTVPAARMKAARMHRVPLSRRAVKLLRDLRPDNAPAGAFIFARDGKALSSMALLMLLRRRGRLDLTTHGFRSTFRTWAAEATNYPREIAEAALAHTIRDKTEAAYARGDLFDRRAKLMEEWAGFCGRDQGGRGEQSEKVVPMRRAGAHS